MTFIKRIFKPIKHIRIRNKLMLIYIVGALIPMILLSIQLSTDVRNILEEKVVSEAKYNIERIEDRLSDFLEKGISVSTKLYFDQVLKQIAVTEFRNEEHRSLVFNSYDDIEDYIRFYEEIHSIQIYVWNNTLPRNDWFVNISEGLDQEDWFKLSIELDGQVGMIQVYDYYQKVDVLALVRNVYNTKDEVIGIMRITYDHSLLNEILESESLESFIILDKEKIVLSSKEDRIKGTVNQDLISLIDTEKKINIITDDYNRQQVIKDEFYIANIPNIFHVFTLVPMTQLNEFVNSEFKSSLFMIILSIVVSGLAIIILTKAFSNRLYLFRRDMHKVVEGELEVVSHIEGDDEIGDLSKDLNQMTESIRTLIHEVYEAKLQKEYLQTKQKDVKFKMLASQINPHFLYNTLETIRMKSIVQGNEEISSIVMKLARIMRRNLSATGEVVTLESELQLIRDYYEIQKFRFRDKISLTIHNHCNIEKYNVLPLLFQPIVENAFIHGLEKKVENGRISIHLYEEDPYLNIIIQDDGVGILPERLIEIKEKLASEDYSIDGSIGVLNVNQRIKIYYGEEYGVSIESDKSGTKVIMRLPLESEEIYV